MDKKELKHRLDRLCSTFVRCRETRCYTCNAPLRYADREAGHFIPREVGYTRWDLQNIHVQCHRCNVFKGGNLQRYANLMRARNMHDYTRLEHIWACYKYGECPELPYDHMKLLYNNLLDMVRERFPQQSTPYHEWQKLE